MGTNRTGFRSLDKLAQDPRIAEVFSGPNSEGVWSHFARLAPGFHNGNGGDTLCGPTVRGLYAAAKKVAAD